MPPNHDSPLPIRVARMEVQMERFISELESEKATRSRANSDIHVHLDKIRDVQERTNRILYMMMGGLVVLQVGLQFFKR